MTSKARRLEQIELEKARRCREAAERARDEVVESAGRLIDAARENPDVDVDEENEAVRELARKTGRSGDRMAAVSAPSAKPG